jgi:signal transduction histidine kinase
MRSNEELAAFAGQVAHDLSSPMPGVRRLLELLAERALGGVGRMPELLDDLLAYAGLGGGVQATPVDLAEVLAEVREDLHVELAAAEVTAAELPVLRADRTQLRALLQNLLSNGARFRRPDRPLRVRVEARQAAAGWRVTVVDNGRGVPTDLREEAFELLIQVHDPELKAGGSGTGLATCRRIATAHGGAIGIDDGDDGGAAVWFTLQAS